MPHVDAAELTYTQVRGLDMTRTICFLPMSALEVHGPHLPLGMDYFMARWMAEETGRRFAAARPEWTVIQLPALPLGTDELPLAGSMHADQRTVYRALLAHGRSLARAGYRYIVVTNGHGGPRHAAALEYACRRISKRHGVHMFTPSILALHRIITGQCFDVVESILGRPLSDGERRGALAGEHAGTWETSFMLADRRTLVDPCYASLPLGGPPAFAPLMAVADRLGRGTGDGAHDPSASPSTISRLAHGVGWLLNAHYGYGGPTVTYQGDPSCASAALGHAFREVMVRECLTTVDAVVSGRLQAVAVRSIASDPPIIQPYFWRAVGIAAAAVVAAVLAL